VDRKLFEDIWQMHSGKIIGVSLGFVIGVLIITLGFFRTIFVLLCVFFGFVVGKRIDDKEDLMDILDKFLPPGYFR
jgi:uncharacterized membrane protein